MFLTGHRFENRAEEIKTKYASIAQLAEHAAVNRGVTGSNPVWGARSHSENYGFFVFQGVQNQILQLNKWI